MHAFDQQHSKETRCPATWPGLILLSNSIPFELRIQPQVSRSYDKSRGYLHEAKPICSICFFDVVQPSRVISRTRFVFPCWLHELKPHRLKPLYLCTKALSSRIRPEIWSLNFQGCDGCVYHDKPVRSFKDLIHAEKYFQRHFKWHSYLYLTNVEWSYWILILWNLLTLAVRQRGSQACINPWISLGDITIT